MSNLLNLVILVFVITVPKWCLGIDIFTDCPGKFEKMNASAFSLKFWGQKPDAELAEYICTQFGLKSYKNPKENEAEKHAANRQFAVCYDGHLRYFTEIKTEKTVVDKYVTYCKNHKIDYKMSTELIWNLRVHCWNLQELSELKVNAHAIKLRVSPADWQKFQIDDTELSKCLGKETPIEKLEDKVKNNKFKLFLNYKIWSSAAESKCDCSTVFRMENFYQKHKIKSGSSDDDDDDDDDDNDDDDDDEASEKEVSFKQFYETICSSKLKSKGEVSTEIHVWTKEQIDIILNFDFTLPEVKTLNIDLKLYIKFLKIMRSIVFKGWYSHDKKYSQWTLSYLIKTSYINNDFDLLVLKTMSKAIRYEYSMDHFDEFIKVTSITEESKTINTWKFRFEIFNVFFSSKRLSDKSYNVKRVNYSGIDRKVINQHLKLLLELKKPEVTSEVFVKETHQILEIFFKSEKMEVDSLTELFTFAKSSNKTLDELHIGLKMSVDSKCDCKKVFRLQNIFYKMTKYSKGQNGEELQSFYDIICYHKEGGNAKSEVFLWTDEHLEVMSNLDLTSDESKSLKLNFKIFIKFLKAGSSIGEQGWCSQNKKHSQWTLMYIIKNSYINNEFDITAIKVISQAIHFDYSMEYFDEFVKITSTEDESKTLNSWKSRQEIFDVIFSSSRLQKKDYNSKIVNYSGIDKKFVNIHLKLFLELKKPSTTVTVFAKEMEKILELYYKSEKMEVEKLTEMLTLAKTNGRNLEELYVSFKISLELNLDGSKVFQMQDIYIKINKNVKDHRHNDNELKSFCQTMLLEKNEKGQTITWTKEQLDAISAFDISLPELKSLKIDFNSVVKFIKIGRPIFEFGWFNKDKKNSQWSFLYLIKNCSVNNDFDLSAVKAISKAIHNDYSVEHFDEFIKNTSKEVIKDDKISIWKCRDEIFDVVFSPSRLADKSYNSKSVNYNGVDKKVVNQHLKLLLELKQPGINWSAFLKGSENIYELFYKNDKITVEKLSEVLTLAKTSGRSSQDVHIGLEIMLSANFDIAKVFKMQDVYYKLNKNTGTAKDLDASELKLFCETMLFDKNEKGEISKTHSWTIEQLDAISSIDLSSPESKSLKIDIKTITKFFKTAGPAIEFNTWFNKDKKNSHWSLLYMIKTSFINNDFDLSAIKSMGLAIKNDYSTEYFDDFIKSTSKDVIKDDKTDEWKCREQLINVVFSPTRLENKSYNSKTVNYSGVDKKIVNQHLKLLLELKKPDVNISIFTKEMENILEVFYKSDKIEPGKLTEILTTTKSSGRSLLDLQIGLKIMLNANCDIGNVFEIQDLYYKLNKTSNSHDEKEFTTFCESMLIAKTESGTAGKSYKWSKEQLEIISNFDLSLPEIKALNIDIKAFMKFLTIAGPLSEVGWYSKDKKDSQWSLLYLIKMSYINAEFDSLAINSMGLAINSGYSMELFDEFIKFTADIKDEKVNIWKCRQDLFNAVFLPGRLENKSYNLKIVNYTGIDRKIVNLHFKLFLELKKPEITWTIFLKEMENFYEIYFKTDKMEVGKLTELLTSAKTTGISVQQLCISFKIIIELNCDGTKVFQLYDVYYKLNKTNADENGFKSFCKTILLDKSEGTVTYSWTNEQMQAISSIDLTSAEAKSLNIDFNTVMKFLKIGGSIGEFGWFSKENKNSQWSLLYIIKISYINQEFDESIIKIMGQAISFGYSMEYFDEFITITSITEDSKTINSWKCRKEIFQVFFSPDRLKNKQNYNAIRLNYSGIDKKYVNQHLKLLLELKKSFTTCSVFTSEIEQILEIFFKSDKLEAESLTEVFTLAISSKVGLERLFLAFRTSLNSTCDITKIMHLQNVYNKYNADAKADDDDGLKKFYGTMCHNKDESGIKSNLWTKFQLQAIWNIDLSLPEVKSLNIDFKTIMKFFTIAGSISESGWYIQDKPHTHWTLMYIIKISYINKEFDPLIIKLLGYAIKYGYSMEYFDEFIKITSITEDSKTINSWKCREEILNELFSPNRLQNKDFNSHRVNYSEIDKKFANEHLKSLLDLKKPATTCTDFLKEIEPILVVYFKSHVIEAEHLTEVFNLAKSSKKNLDQLLTCFKFSDDVEKEVMEHKLLTKPDNLNDKQFVVFQEKAFEIFRKLIVNNQDIKELCENKNSEYNGKGKDNVIKLFKHLFSYEDHIDNLNPIFKVEKN